MKFMMICIAILEKIMTFFVNIYQLILFLSQG